MSPIAHFKGRVPGLKALRLVVVAALLWASSAYSALAQQTSTLLFLNSQSGDYIGQGQQRTLDPTGATFTPSRNNKNGVSFSVIAPGLATWWYLDLAAPNNAPLTAGVYEGATRYPFESISNPGLALYGDGRGCNTLTGRFVVFEATYANDGSVLTFAADFEQHCEGGQAALFGSIRYNYLTTPTQVSAYQGDGQVAAKGSFVPIAPAVVVRDQTGLPVPGVSVTFAVETGGGFVVDEAQDTDLSGVARVGAWILGNEEGFGNNTLSATAPGLSGSPVLFNASVAPATPTLLNATTTGVALAASGSCALTSRGSVKCWGTNHQVSASPALTPLDFPGLSTDVVALAARRFHSCALSSSGGVKCWGENVYGQLGNGITSAWESIPVMVEGLASGVSAIATGSSHSCALTAQGAVKCWGDNTYGQVDGMTGSGMTPLQVPGLEAGVIAITAGGTHTCALMLEGTVRCWGWNVYGQVGDGTTGVRSGPIQVSGLTGVTAVQAGSLHTCAIVASGRVKCWGNNLWGQLGDETTLTRLSPVDVIGVTGAARLASGEGHSCAVTDWGGIKCWGRNVDGELGDGTQVERHSATTVRGLGTPVSEVFAGVSHTCALAVDGGLKCWGRNLDGQLGNGTTTSRPTPSDVAGLASGVSLVSTGLYHTCAATRGGTVQCWGNNLDGELGDGTQTSRGVPMEVVGLSSGVVQVSAGGYHTCAVTATGPPKCWGYNGLAALGDNSVTSRTVPVAVVQMSDASQISAGLYHTCAITKSGGLRCWGNNQNGQLGNGFVTTLESTPGLVYGLSVAAAVTAGDFHTCALTTAGGAKCWGSNLNGKLGDGTTTQRVIPGDAAGLTSGVKAIVAGAQHTCALTTAGGVKCWGLNAGGQIGDGTTTTRLTPTDVVGLASGVTSIAAGKFHTCAVTNTGRLKCWGWNADGQIGDGTGTQQLTPTDVVGLTSNAALVSTGGYHTCAITVGGGLQCWGYNGYGELGDETSSSRRAPVVIHFGQSIQFEAPTQLAEGITTILRASASSGLPPEFDTWTPSTCVVAGNRVRVLAGASGLCGIRVSQAGDSRHAAAPQQLRLIPTFPSMAIANTSVLEGSSSIATASFAVTLSGPSTDTVTALFATSDVNATSNVDYTPVSGTITFAPGEVSKTINVDVIGDTSVEPTEYFKVTLSALSGAGPGDIEALGAIIDDDSLDPTSIGISSARGPEGYLAGSTLAFPVRLSRPATAPVTVNYATAAGTATPGADFTSTSGQLSFGIGDFEKFVLVQIIGDAIAEPNETFTVTLSSPTGATIAPGQGTATGTILNDDLSTISVTDFAIAEGTTGTPNKLAFTVILSATSTSTVTVDYATASGTATAGSDYTPVSGTLSFPPGVASLVVQVPIIPDAVVEPNETVLLNLSNAVGATIFDGQGVGTILADDGLLVSIGDKTTPEGDTGFTPVTFTVSLSAPAPGTVTVDYATADGTATAPLDYTAANGTVTFNTGEQTKTVTIQVVGDTEKEPYETFFVDLSNPTGGANIGDGRGQGTITNTDGATDRSRLMFHNFVTNRLYRWHMKNGNTLDTFNWVTPWATDPGWTVGAVADFDQDGQLDYLWHNLNDGRMLFWYIDGDNLKGYQFLPYQMGPPWTVATTFDADGNGTPDLVFYNSATGVVRVMRHDNATLLGQYDLTTLLPGTGTVRVVAAVDANNDGDDELALYNSATGHVQAWDVTGANVTSTTTYANTQATSPSFTLVSTKTDFNNDGLADFLWHNPTPTGIFSVWFMNGTTRLGTGVFQPFTATDPVWRVVGSANVW